MLTVDKVENKYVVSFYNINKLNILNAKELELKLIPLVSQRESSLIINFAGIKFIDSSGFDVLLNIFKVSNLNDSSLRFINLSDELMELMKLVELDKVFQLN
jgi:anti-anti-sigma factor